LEKSLRILFETKDASLVKRFVQRQFGKISSGKIPLQDLTFAREFRGMSGYRPNACVPALELTK
jgi:DNA polymerase zeta